jgi:hypothetical protein
MKDVLLLCNLKPIDENGLLQKLVSQEKVEFFFPFKNLTFMESGNLIIYISKYGRPIET